VGAGVKALAAICLNIFERRIIELGISKPYSSAHGLPATASQQCQDWLAKEKKLG